VTSVYKHCVSMKVAWREITEIHEDHVVVVEHLMPDPSGPYLVMSDGAEPAWAMRRSQEPRKFP